jgi:phosphotriesterase-related protein
MSTSINTVSGSIAPAQLGRTLMHEHVFVEYGGPSPDTSRPSPRRDEIVSVCTGYIEQIRAFNVATLVDPTTIDLGRNVLLIAEIAAKAGFNIICATGIYSTATYVQMRERLGGSSEAVAALFIKELTEGIDTTGIKAGIIKVVTGAPMISTDEHELLLTAAKASVATGVPIITHTEGILGDEQQRILTGAGVPAQRIIVGHSCISRSFDYHMRIVRGGSYLAFDRFGMPGMSDEARVAALQKLLDAGCASRLMVSHDSVWYWVDRPTIGAGAYKDWVPTNFFERIIPLLHYGGATDEHIETMLCKNPRQFFADEQLKPIA